MRLQIGGAPGDRYHDFYLKGDRMTWHHSLKTKQIPSVRQEGLIIAKYKLIMHKCVHFKENDLEKAHVEKSRESSLGDGQTWAAANNQQPQGRIHRMKILQNWWSKIGFILDKFTLALLLSCLLSQGVLNGHVVDPFKKATEKELSGSFHPCSALPRANQSYQVVPFSREGLTWFMPCEFQFLSLPAIKQKSQLC